MIILSENMPVFSVSFKFHLNECLMDFCDARGHVKISLQTYQATWDNSRFELLRHAAVFLLGKKIRVV